MGKKLKLKLETKIKVFEPARIDREVNASVRVKKEALKTLRNALKTLERGTPRYERVETRIKLLEG